MIISSIKKYLGPPNWEQSWRTPIKNIFYIQNLLYSIILFFEKNENDLSQNHTF